MTDETTAEQLAEIEGQGESTPATEYTPPDGWRVLRSGELLQPGDHWVNWEGTVSRPDIQHGDGATVSGGRYLRRIKPQPEPVPEPDAELRIRLLKEANDSQAETIGRLLTEARDLNMEIGGLERRLSERDARIRDLETMHAAATQAVVDAGKVNDKLRAQAEELRSEVSYVQNLLGESNRKVTQLEDLVGSLRTINDAQEKAFEAAGQHNGDLQSRLNAVCSEWSQQAETIRRLQIELDAAQQVPADSPEIRQLRADLEQMTLGRDTYRDGYERVLSDLVTARKTAKAEAVEAVAEWLEPVQAAIAAADNVAESTRAGWLAEEVIQHLPKIMRSLTGLDSPEDVD